MLNKKKLIASVLMLSCGLSVLVGCSDTPNQTQNPQPQPTATSSATPASPSPSESPDNPNPGASEQPDNPNPSDNPSTSPSEDPSANPSSEPSDISTEANTTLNGMIFDDTGAPLDEVTVHVQSLSTSRPFEATTISQGGAYVLNSVPAGVQLEIAASKPGFAPRKMVKVLKSNKNGDPDANRFDFGTSGGPSAFGNAYNALSDKPEVIAVTPERNATGIAPNTDIVLTFSEPMDRQTVLDNFEIRAFSSEQLSVDNATTLIGAGSLTTPTAGTQIWDDSAFAASWNADDTQLTLHFLDDRALPSDKESANIPDYLISLQAQGGQIKDKDGNSRSLHHFKLTAGDFEDAYKFSLLADQEKPRLESLSAQTYENGGSDGDAIKLRYSERMVLYTQGPIIAGGMNGNAAQAPAANGPVSAAAAAGNYTVTVTRGGQPILTGLSWGTLGGQAIFDSADASHHTVRLMPPQAAVSSGAQTIGANADAMQAITGMIYYRDGSSDAINVTPAANSYAQLETALNGLLSGSPFTVTEVTDNDGNLEAGDTYRIQLSAGAQNTAGDEVAMVLLNHSGAFGTADLNAPDGGLRLFPGAVANVAPDIYRPGDKVTVEANNVLDPAGNTLSSTDNDASGTAS